MLLFFGAPGVGKGTQAKIISAKLHIAHISTGDILRTAISKKTELGLKAKDKMDRGELVSDETMVKLVHNVLKAKSRSEGFILDGFPRTLNQAKILQPIVDELFDDPLLIISLDADTQVIIDRLAQRRMCNTCSGIINLNFLANPKKCPSCGSVNSFIKRKDDEVDVIKNRLDIFHKTTKPVLEFYKDHAVIHSIDGTLPVDKITTKILDVIG
jgi:adenylate kinase